MRCLSERSIHSYLSENRFFLVSHSDGENAGNSEFNTSRQKNDDIFILYRSDQGLNGTVVNWRGT